LAAAREAVIGDFRKLTWDDVVIANTRLPRLAGVAPDSRTETFVAARIWIDNERWRGVPFLLRTGKTMPLSRQRISIIFRQPDTGLGQAPPMGNVLSFELSGDGEILLRLVTKEPGPVLKLGPASPACPWGRVSTRRRCPRIPV